MTENIWFGDQNSFAAYCDAMKRIQDPAYLAEMRSAWSMDQEQEDDERFDSWLLKKSGNVALLSVNGSLTNTKKWYNRYMSLVSYEEITEALSEAGERDDIDTVVMTFSTGGGTAAGIKAASDFIQHFDANIKPVYGFTDSAAFSAGYWLYSATRKNYVSDMGQLGSIGAIATHVSYKDMLDKAGIVYTAFREGEFKALGQPFEKLDQKTKDQFQEKLAKANSFFLDAVIQNRSLSLSTQSDWGEGKTFYGREALGLGLADEVVTLHELLGRFTTQSSGNGQTRYDGGTMPKEKLETQDSSAADTEQVAGAGLDTTTQSATTLSEEDKAKLAAGLPLEGVDLKGVEATAETEEEMKPGLNDGEPGDGELDANARVADLESKLEAAEAKLSAAETLCEQMKGVVLASADKQLIAMGGVAVDMSFLDAATALQHYEKVNARFEETFKVGARSKPVEEERQQDEEVNLASVPTAFERAHAKNLKK